MGTVRREGDWRLEKRREGVYEITFRKEPQMKVLTPDPSNPGQQQLFETLPVREVSSFGEAEGLFEEKAHGPPPMGMEPSVSSGSGSQSATSQDENFGEDVDLSEVPPGMFGIALLVAGSFILYTFWGAGNQIALLLGVGFAGVGVVILGYGAFLFRAEGWREGWEFLTTAPADESDASSKSSDTEKTPPAPQKLKDELFFERANRQCEYCGETIDHFEVHHITPRSEGGENTPENLIVLCPNCHTMADRGSISKSRLRYQIDN